MDSEIEKYTFTVAEDDSVLSDAIKLVNTNFNQDFTITEVVHDDGNVWVTLEVSKSEDALCSIFVLGAFTKSLIFERFGR